MQGVLGVELFRLNYTAVLRTDRLKNSNGPLEDSTVKPTGVIVIKITWAD